MSDSQIESTLQILEMGSKCLCREKMLKQRDTALTDAGKELLLHLNYGKQNQQNKR